MMNTKLTDKIYIEQATIEPDYKASWEKFLAGDESTAFEGVYQKVDALLQKRWVKMQGDWVYDHNVKGAWLGLCNDKFTADSYLAFNTGTQLHGVLEAVKKKHATQQDFDIPTKDELLNSLTRLTSAPFALSNQTSAITNLHYTLHKKANNVVQAFYCDARYLCDRGAGLAIPFLRLTNGNQFKLSKRETFFRWLVLGLTPVGLKDDKDYIFCREQYANFDITLKKYTQITHASLKGDAKLKLSADKIIDQLLHEDKTRADLKPYNQKMLEDTEQGHWSLWRDHGDDLENPVLATLNTKLVARDPKSSIIDGTVGIDFGTKSTVVVYQKDTTKIYPMRIGTGDLSKTIASAHYENPTIMEFNHLARFHKAYTKRDGRPYTAWEDLTISHTAHNALLNSPSGDFNAFISELKQWAGNKDKKLKMVDKQGFVLDLPAFLDMDENHINPIEIYAYYLGLYINNHNNGIYLNYILSFPVTYELNIRDKIIESFEKGIRKSLPQELHNQAEALEKLSVIRGASEPAAYAIIALQEYGFEPEDDEKVFYGVFDFGGGTTDFDFGIYREATGKKERRYDYAIEHFGAGGDRYLGGENLLELLAFEVFKKNKQMLLEHTIQFMLPPECDEFLGSESLLSLSREAKMNTKSLMEKLRPFWEGVEDEIANFENGVLAVNLSDVDAVQQANFELDIDTNEMYDILMGRIEKGVKNFFHSLRLAFNNHEVGLSSIAEINIFLAGNSSKSKLVQDIFKQEIATQTLELKEAMGTDKDIFKIFSPLGGDGENLEKPTGKTGVAFGLIETREGGDILVIDHNIKANKHINFKYYLGESRKKKFKVLVDKKTEFNTWIDFVDASTGSFELYYSSQSMVSSNKVSINDSSIKKMILKIDVVDDDASVFVSIVSASKISYVVADEEGIKEGQYLGDIQTVNLKDI